MITASAHVEPSKTVYAAIELSKKSWVRMNSTLPLASSTANRPAEPRQSPP